MGKTTLKTQYKLEDVELSNLRSGVSYSIKRTDRIICGRISVDNVPSGSNTLLGNIPYPPKDTLNITAVNGSVGSVIQVTFNDNGSITAYQATGSSQGFFGLGFTYVYR